jgi:hypothetical protein
MHLIWLLCFADGPAAAAALPLAVAGPWPTGMLPEPWPWRNLQHDRVLVRKATYNDHLGRQVGKTGVLGTFIVQVGPVRHIPRCWYGLYIGLPGSVRQG